jgi:hypothetical protein
VNVFDSVTVYGHSAGGNLRRSGPKDSKVIESMRVTALVLYRGDASGGQVLSTRTGRLAAVHLGGHKRGESNRGLLIAMILAEGAL